MPVGAETMAWRERIALGILAQSEGMLATELATVLDLPDPASLRLWISRLAEHGLVKQTGRTRATRYFVHPNLVQSAGLQGQTTLKRIEPHRLPRKFTTASVMISRCELSGAPSKSYWMQACGSTMTLPHCQQLL